jgi:type I restriction enzyme S subunit
MSYFASSDQLPEWARQIPDDWDKDWLKWNVSLCTRRPTEEQRASLPYLSNEDIAPWTGKLLRDELEPNGADSRMFQSGDVLFNKLRPYLAKVFHADFAGTSSGELLCLRPSEQVAPRYLFYVLTSFGFIDAVDSHTFGSKMPRADWETVGHQPLPLPSAEAQQRIVRFLDEKTMRIDALIEKKQALLEQLTEKRQALITRAVTQGLNRDVPMNASGLSWIADVPRHWQVKRLRFLCEGGTLNGLYKSKEQFALDGVPFVQMGEAFRADVFDGETKDRVLSSDAELKKWGLRTGDFLIARRSLVFDGSGKSVMIGALEEGHLFESSMIRLRLSSPLELSSFVSNYFQSSVCRALILSITKQVTISGIDSQQLKDVQIPVPPRDEALEISAACKAFRDHIGKAVDAAQRSIASLAEYRSALITAAVTGQLPELNG